MMMTPNNFRFNVPSQDLSPGTAFPTRTQYGGSNTTSYKKLSQFNQEKRQRRMVAPIDNLGHI